MDVKKLAFNEFKTIYSKVPRLCVDLVIKNKQGVLLTKRNIPPDLGWLHFPGGTVLMREALKDTIQRVAKEELNTKVEIKKLLGFLEYNEGIGYFNSIPEKTLPEVKKFLKRNLKL